MSCKGPDPVSRRRHQDISIPDTIQPRRPVERKVTGAGVEPC